jgi:uncharacterized protein (TIGR01777 family)
MRLDDAILDESSAAGADDLAQVCVAWEAAADPARTVGVRVVHPRIGMVLARGGGALAKLEAPYRAFVGGPLGSGRQWISWVHRRDVVRSILFVLEHETCSGPLNVVAPEPVTMEAFARAFGRALRRPAALRAPAFALKIALGDGLASLLLTGQRVAPRGLQAAGFEFAFPHLDAALADLYGAAGAAS